MDRAVTLDGRLIFARPKLRRGGKGFLRSLPELGTRKIDSFGWDAARQMSVAWLRADPSHRNLLSGLRNHRK